VVVSRGHGAWADGKQAHRLFRNRCLELALQLGYSLVSPSAVELVSPSGYTPINHA